MIDVLLLLLGFVALAVLAGAGIALVTGTALGVLLGRFVEALSRVLVPGRRTGLGPEGLAGAVGTVVKPFAPDVDGSAARGMVRVNGELWRAEATVAARLPEGARVRVVEVRGLEVFVEPVRAAGRAGGSRDA